MRKTQLLKTLIFLLSVGSVPSESRSAAHSDSLGFRYLVNEQVTVEEAYVRTPEALNGTLRILSEGEVKTEHQYSATLNQNGCIEHVTLSVWRADTHRDSRPFREWIVTARGDTVTQRAQTGSGEEIHTRRIATASGTVPIFTLSIAMQEQLLRCTGILDAKNQQVQVPLFAVAEHAGIFNATLTRTGSSSVQVQMAPYEKPVEMTYRLDAAGRIVSGSDPASPSRVQRVQ